MGEDHYRTLGVHPRADFETIKAAYRRRARRLHPDVNPGYGATERMVALNSAYEVLSDPVRRAAYDRVRLGRAFAPVDGSPSAAPDSGPVWPVQGPWDSSRDRWRLALRTVGTVLALAGVALLVWAVRP